jgi:hypothetical protein
MVTWDGFPAGENLPLAFNAKGAELLFPVIGLSCDPFRFVS